MTQLRLCHDSVKMISDISELLQSNDVKNDELLFSKCVNYKTLVYLMTSVLMGKISSPIYNFIPLHKKISENYWWFTTEKWRLIRNINSMGVITLCTEEGHELDGLNNISKFWRKNGVVAQNFRISLTCICPRFMYDLIHKSLLEKGFLIFKDQGNSYSVQNESKYKVCLSENIYNDGKLKTLSNMSTYYQNISKDVLNCHLNEKMVEYLEKITIEIIVVDPFWNRKADSPDGLYTIFHNIIKNIHSESTSPEMMSILFDD